MIKVSVIALFLTCAPLSSPLMAQQADSTAADQQADNAATADAAPTLNRRRHPILLPSSSTINATSGKVR
jgi:hypothetical protein